MEEICRLCCSTKFVNNDIFDEENALYLKMSLYLPIKVFKNDRLPQKVCDRCSCKVNDLYQFCNETIEVQNRLRAVLISSAVAIEDSVDLTLIKDNDLSPPPVTELDQKVNLRELKAGDNCQLVSAVPQNINTAVPSKVVCEQSTQTDYNVVNIATEVTKEDVSKTFSDVKVKEEPKQEDVKTEDDFGSDNMLYDNMASDDTNSDEDMALIQFQKKKKAKKNKLANGQTEKRKRKKRNDEWDMIIKAIPEGTAVTMVKDNMKVDVKQELQEDIDVTETLVQDLGLHTKVKSEPEEYNCCMCFVQCYTRNEMLQHYKEHMSNVELLPPPPAPAPPAPAADNELAKCPRCMKRLSTDEWSAHWVRHWVRDRRPLRCALCQKTFAEPNHIMRHGASHKLGEENADGNQSLEKRFICDICPEGFVYMRHLLSHRATNHPEAAAKALALRCAICQRQFAHLNSLRRHLHAHKGERNFLCSICGKALSSREHLKFHIRIHTGYKPNVCKTCGKGFVKKCNLTLHERVHTGERPHVCAHCGKAFSQRSTLVIHERYHSGARPYVCTLCGRGFVAKGLLSMHLKTTCI